MGNTIRNIEFVSLSAGGEGDVLVSSENIFVGNDVGKALVNIAHGPTVSDFWALNKGVLEFDHDPLCESCVQVLN